MKYDRFLVNFFLVFLGVVKFFYVVGFCLWVVISYVVLYMVVICLKIRGSFLLKQIVCEQFIFFFKMCGEESKNEG